MLGALGAAFLWLIVANVAAMVPSRDHHWRRAFVLIIVGIPILGWVTWTEGPFWGMVMLAAGASVLRWPVIYLVRWLRRKGAEPAE
jgi:hypothetical protein